MNILLQNWKPIALAVAALSMFLIGWTANGWRYQADISKMKQEYAEALASATDEANRVQAEAAEKIASIDGIHIKELANAKNEIDRLNAAVSAGSVGLRVKATCGPSVQKATSGSGLGDAASPRLDDSAKRNYFVLRERIALITSQLKACQDIVVSDRE